MVSTLSRNRARAGVSAAFMGHAIVSGSWAARVPAIKSSLGLSDTQLGLALLGMAIGTLLGGRLGGVIAGRAGARRVVRVGVPVFGVTMFLASVAPDLAALAAVLVAVGVLASVVDVAMNIEAVVVERDQDQPLMSGFHGLWSVGLLIGAVIGAGAAAAGIGPELQFGLVAIAVAASTATLLARLPERAGDQRKHKPVASGWSIAVVLFGLIAAASFFAEGVASSWSAVYLHDRAAAGAALAAIGFAGFSLGMVASRLYGDRLIAAFGPVRVVLTSSLMAAAGLTAAVVLPVPAVGVIGFTLLGLGLGPVVPTVVSAVGRAGLGTDESVVSQVFTIGYFGGVSGPAVIGLIAGRVGLRAALIIPICLVLYIASASPRLATGAGRSAAIARRR
jgi:fucose permease